MKDFYPEGWLNDTTENKKNMITPSALAAAALNGTVLEAVATMCDAEHNLIVNLGCMRGIIPRNEGAIGIDNGTTRDIALISRVGRPVCFTVSELKTDSRGVIYALLSRKKAQEKCLTYLFENHKSGDIIDAKITHFESFGVFCDIGCGNIALLPIDSVSVARIFHPKDRFNLGDNIKVIIKDISVDGKITLSHKELLGTWEENAALFSQGQTVTGIIRSIEDYGAFVELTPNLAGLAEPKSGVYVGQQASVYIKSIIPEKMKIKLIIIDSHMTAPPSKPMRYFVDPKAQSHIGRWCYSPACCARVIESVF